jgi:hypothetical protein
MKLVCPEKNEMKNEDTQTDLELQRTYTPTRGSRVWRSCCLRCDRDIVQYFTKYIILVALMIFFSIELHLADTCEGTQLYQSMLTLVLGIALPNPRIK